MRRLIVVVSLLAAACGGRPLTSDEQDALKLLRARTHVLVDVQRLSDLETKADLTKSVGRFSQFPSYGKTWRLDSATGHICLLLATEAQWKETDSVNSKCEP